MQQQQKQQTVIDTVIGPLYLVATEAGLCGIFWKEQAVATGMNGILRQAVAEIREYLAGDRRVFAVPIAVEAGTAFQRCVWRELRKIPYGATISYKELAQRVARPKAVRAVGSANGRNPLSIIVPCHRVIQSDGSLGGYAGGLSVKESLLRLERTAR